MLSVSEATVRTRHGRMDCFQIGKGVHQGCILSPCSFNLYAAAKSLQSCPTLCNPIDSSPPGSATCLDSPGKNTGVGCHFLLQCMKVKSETEVAQSCPTLSDPMDCSLPGSSIHGIFQARVLEWVAIAFSVTYMQSTSREMPGWMKHKLESRLSGEISVTSDTQVIPPI